MNQSLKEFISTIESKQKREDTESLVKLMEEASGFKPFLDGKIIGFGLYDFKYKNGKDGRRIVTGFSPRKQNLTIYVMNGFENYQNELEKLGKYKISDKCCLYINKLADVNETILKNIIKRSVADMAKRHHCREA